MLCFDQADSRYCNMVPPIVEIQLCHSSSPLTLSILNKIIGYVISPYLEQKTRSLNINDTDATSPAANFKP